MAVKSFNDKEDIIKIQDQFGYILLEETNLGLGCNMNLFYPFEKFLKRKVQDIQSAQYIVQRFGNDTYDTEVLNDDKKDKRESKKGIKYHMTMIMLQKLMSYPKMDF